MSKIFLIFFIISIGVFIDQFTKGSARTTLEMGKSIIVIPKILNWELVLNDGAAFNILAGEISFVTFASTIAVFSIFIYLLKNFSKCSNLKIIYLSLLLTGALGNLIDRIIFHKVTDFIDLLILPGNFPIFNFADVLINLGVFLLITEIFMKKFFGTSLKK